MRASLKLIVFVLATILISPLLVGMWLERACCKTESFFQGVSQLLSLVPFKVGIYIRAAFYTHACNEVDREINIGFLTVFSHSDTDIGKHVYIGSQSNIGSCSLGRDCLLGSGVHILSGKRQHSFSDQKNPIRLQGGVFEKIQIGENCWIGNQATIMASIGPHSVVAAGAVVIDEVPPHVIVGGNPARVLRSR